MSTFIKDVYVAHGGSTRLFVEQRTGPIGIVYNVVIADDCNKARVTLFLADDFKGAVNYVKTMAPVLGYESFGGKLTLDKDL